MFIENRKTFSITREDLKEIAELLDSIPETSLFDSIPEVRPKAAAIRTIASGMRNNEIIKSDGCRTFISNVF